MSYTDIVICIEPDRFLETWPPIYRGQERTVRDRLRVSQVDHHVYSRYTPYLTDFTFEFIRRPIPPIISPSSRTFVELNPRQLETLDLRSALCKIPKIRFWPTDTSLWSLGDAAWAKNKVYPPPCPPRHL
jgi:hypothetical protein